MNGPKSQINAPARHPNSAVKTQLAEGRRLMDAGEYGSAIISFRRELSKQAGHPDLYLNLGRALIGAKLDAEARAPLRKALSAPELRTEAYYELGRAEFQTGRSMRALAAFRLCLKARPDWGDAHVRFAEALLKIGQAEAAKTAAMKAVALDPNLPGSYRILGLAFAKLRQFEESAIAFGSWALLQPKNAKPEFYRARVLMLAGSRAAALAAGRSALARNADGTRINLFTARVALALGDVALAEDLLKLETRRRPKSAMARGRLAEALLKRGRYAQAANAATLALGLSPSWNGALVTLVRAYIGLGQLDKAEAALDSWRDKDTGSSWLSPLRREIAALTLQNRPQAEAAPQVAFSKPTTSESYAVGSAGAPQLAATPTVSLMSFVARQNRAASLDVIDHLLIIRALILRDLRVRYRADSIGFALEFLRPLIVIFAHYYLFWLIKKPMPANIPIFTFVIAGFPVWFAFNGAFQGASNAGYSPGRATLLPKVTTFHLQFARAAWTWMLNLMICLFGSIPFTFFGIQTQMPDLDATLLIFALAGVMGFGLGVVAEQLSGPWPMSKIIIKLLMWAAFVTSGQYVSIVSVKRTFAEVLWFNPLLHLVEFERHAFDPGYPVNLVTLLYPSAIAIGLLMLALMGLRATRYAAIA